MRTPTWLGQIIQMPPARETWFFRTKGAFSCENVRLIASAWLGKGQKTRFLDTLLNRKWSEKAIAEGDLFGYNELV